jgi:ATP-binding protein involved in chromosome partitioning
MKKDLENSIITALRTVQDPDLKQDLVTLNMIRDLSINDNNTISFTLFLTTPACPLKEILKQNCIKAINSAIGDNWKIEIQFDSQVTTQNKKNIDLPNIKNIVAVASGKGGVGKSTIAANIAVSLAQQGASVGLLDADIFGPSIPIMFRCEKEKPLLEKVDGKNYISPIHRHNIKLMSIGLLTSEESSAIVWRGPMASKALRQLITDTLWGNLDYLFVDLPPGTGDIHITLAQCVPLTGAIIVTTPQRVATADAVKAIDLFTKQLINIPIIGIVENMAYYTSPGKEDKHFLFGQNGGRIISEKFGVPFLGQVPLDPKICEGGDRGLPIVLYKNDPSAMVLHSISQLVAQQISIHNSHYVSSPI